MGEFLADLVEAPHPNEAPEGGGGRGKEEAVAVAAQSVFFSRRAGGAFHFAFCFGGVLPLKSTA